MIQKLILLLIVPMFLFSFNDDKKYSGLTRDEIKFVKIFYTFRVWQY